MIETRSGMQTWSSHIQHPDGIRWVWDSDRSGIRTWSVQHDVKSQQVLWNYVLAGATYQSSTNDGGARLNTGGWSFKQLGSAVLLSAVIVISPVLETKLPLSTNVGVEVAPQQASHLSALAWIENATKLSQDSIADLLGVSRPTMHSWKQGSKIRDTNRQRLLAVHDVLTRAAARHPTHDELITWLDTPRGAAGLTPRQLLMAGKIDRARALAISTPSVGLRRDPEWVERSVAERVRTEEQYFPEPLPFGKEDGEQPLFDEEDEGDEWDLIIP